MTQHAPSPVELFRTLTQAAPPRMGIMQTEAHYEATGEKYLDYTGRLSTGQIREHLAGTRTYAVPAAHSGGTGRTCWGALDIDDNAKQKIPRIVRAGAKIGVPLKGEIFDHDRGYVHVRFESPQDAQRVTALLQHILRIAGVVDVDVRTTTSAITRLPWARHVWTGKRGTWLQENGELVDLNAADAATLQRLCEEWAPVDPAHLPVVKAPPPSQAPSPTTGSLIAQFNRDHDVEALLQRYGAKQQRGSGRGLYLCPFHPDKHPSLKVYKDQRGHLACRCYSRNSNCPLSERGHYDAFNVYCIGEGSNSEPLAPLEALKRRYPECLTAESQKPQTTQQGTATPATSKPQPLSLNAIAEHTAKKQTLTGAWRIDQELRCYVKEHGSTGVYALHLACEKLGEDATNAALNAEISRKRGKPYDARHLRRLKAERRHIIADWDASKQPRGEDILSPVSVYKVLSNSLASEGGNSTAPPAAHLHAEDLQADLPMETPPIGDIAPLVVTKGKRKRATLPKQPTIADIPLFEAARDRARGRMRYLAHFEQKSAARAVNRRVLEYERIIADLEAQRAALQPSLLEHQPAEPPLPPTQASGPGIRRVSKPQPAPSVPVAAVSTTVGQPIPVPSVVRARAQLLRELQELDPGEWHTYSAASEWTLRLRVSALRDNSGGHHAGVLGGGTT